MLSTSNICQCSNSAGRLHSTLSINKDLKSTAPCHAVGCYSLLYSLICLGFDSYWAKQCLGRVLRTKVLHCRWTAGPEVHTCCTLLCLPIWPLWQHKHSVHGQNFGESKIHIKVGGFPPSYFVGHKAGACMRDELLWSRSGSVLTEYPKHSSGFVQSMVLQHQRKGKMLGRDFWLTINWKSNNRRKS